MDHPARPRVNWWRLLGWILTAIALGFIINWLVKQDHTIWRTALHLRLGWLLGAMAFFLLWFYLRATAWDRISRLHGYGDGRHVNLRLWAQSELLRYVPGNVWSFAARFRGTTEGGATRGASAQAVVLEGLLQITGAVVVTLWFWMGGPWKLLALLLFILFPWAAPKIIPWAWKLLRRKSELPPVSSSSLNLLLGLYTGIWLVFGLGSAALYYAFGSLPLLSVNTLVGLNVTSWLLGYLSIITPMGLGVREVATVRLLQPWLASGPASIVAVVTRLWLIVSEVVFFALTVVLSRRRR